MTHNIKEYKGEKILADLTARLDPPNDYYQDCMCDLALTKTHLYVLEAEYDGSYSEHFAFPISQILELGTGKYQEMVSGQGATYKPLLLNALGSIFGFFITSRQGQRVQTSKSFIITYQDGKGGTDRLYFKDLESTPATIKAVFETLKDHH